MRDGVAVVCHTPIVQAQPVVEIGKRVVAKTWLADANLLPSACYQDIGCDGCNCHPGFLSTYQSVSQQVYDAVSALPSGSLIITGHSLGGSRALHYGLQYVSQNKAEVHAFNPGSSMVEGLDRLVESFQTHVAAKSFVHHIGGDVISMGNQPKYGNITYIVYEMKFRPHSILHFVDFNTIRVRTDLPENLKCSIMTYQTSDTILNHIGSRQANELGHDDLISISADQGNEEDFTLKFYDHTDTNVLFHWGTPSCSEITVKPGKHYIISYLDNAWSVEEVFSCFAYIRRNAGAVRNTRRRTS